MSYVIDELSSKIPDFQQRFEFFGLVLAKAIFDEIPLNLCLNKLVYRLLLNPNAAIEVEDIKGFDSSVYNSLQYIRDNNIDDDEFLELYFQHEFNGSMYDLAQDGENIKVTDGNKDNYMILKSEFMVKNFVYDQIEAIRRGFFKLIPGELLNNFSDEELAYLCSGENGINLDDWKQHTHYSGVYNHNHNVIQWFWEIMNELDDKSLRIIFQFVTGMSRLPAGGFNSLNKNRGERQFFNIRSMAYEENNSLPKAYTCFNRLLLPVYPDEDALRDNVQAIINHNEIYGFGLEE